jgi:hypothetical protein
LNPSGAHYTAEDLLGVSLLAMLSFQAGLGLDWKGLGLFYVSVLFATTIAPLPQEVLSG